MGFILHCVIYGSVWVLPMAGYGVHGYRCSVGKSDPWVTHFKPYAEWQDSTNEDQSDWSYMTMQHMMPPFTHIHYPTSLLKAHCFWLCQLKPMQSIDTH